MDRYTAWLQSVTARQLDAEENAIRNRAQKVFGTLNTEDMPATMQDKLLKITAERARRDQGGKRIPSAD